MSGASLRIARAVLLVACAGACAGAPGGPGVAGSAGTASSSSSEAMVVLPERDATVMAAAIVVPGSAWELAGTHGLTALTAAAMVEGARPRLDSLGARSDVECGPAAFVFHLIAPAETGGAAMVAWLEAVFRPRLEATALGRGRERLATSLALDAASPAWQARLAGRQALYGDTAGESRWAVPACGLPETLARFDTAWVRAGAYRFQPERATVAVVGAVRDPERVRAILRERLPTGPRPPLPAPRRTRPGRRYVERNTVTAWLTVAWPFGADVDVEAVRAVGALLEAAVAPGVARPEVLDVSVEVARHGGGGALLVHVVVDPSAAAAYADRLEAERAALAGAERPASALERVLVRERGRRLRARGVPEARAAAVALELALGGAADDGWPALEAVTPAGVRAAAAALGPAARSVVGPRSARGAVIGHGGAP